MPNSPAHTDAAPPSLASLDEQIVAAIAGGCAEFHAIAGAVRATAILLARAPRPLRLGVDEPGRLIDKRLQSLRKAGRIKFLRPKGWRVVAASSHTSASNDGEKRDV